jgi:hypothetical protein
VFPVRATMVAPFEENRMKIFLNLFKLMSKYFAKLATKKKFEMQI